MKWKDEYSCYDSNIDRQHMKLIELIDKMEEILDLNDNFDHYDEIVVIFSELKEYTVYHFTYEEELMEKSNYDSSSIKIQKLEHKSFIKKIDGIDFAEIDENQIESVRQILDFTAKWIDQHILRTDRNFGMFLQEKA